MPCWLQVFQGLMTPVIGFLALYIAWQQAKDSRLKIKMENYERRLKIFHETHRFISKVSSSGQPELEDMFTFAANTAEADFLFPSKIREYLDQAFRQANSLRTANKQYRDINQPPPPPGYDHMKVCEAMDTGNKWFDEQTEVVKELFKPYLSIG